MYIPKNMQVLEQEVITQFIHDNGFAVLLSDTLDATHLPLIYRPEEGVNGTIYGHVARANPHWKQLDKGRVLVIFSGPHGYISPSWYASGPAVPTWNYAAVHCVGNVALLGPEATTLSMDRLVEKYEPELLSNQQVMPSDYRNKLAKAVVGFKIEVTEIHAKEKLGQHRKVEDQKGVTYALENSQFTEHQELLAYMKKRALGVG